jgi:hypothetical protein
MAPEVDHSSMMLGKEAVKTDVRTLLFARYVTRTELPPAPDTLDLADKVAEWPMYANDRLGDCTCAAAGHMIEAWTGEAGRPVAEVTESDVVAAFEQVKSCDEKGECGAVELDVLNYWRKSGIGGHKIGAFAKIPTFDPAVVKVGCWIFGGLYIGLQLPISAQTQEVWDWRGSLTGPDEPRSWGGHAVDVVQYDADGVTVVTWGSLKRMTWSFWERYCDEAYCLISEDFLTGTEKTPDGFDIETLRADLELVKG